VVFEAFYLENYESIYRNLWLVFRDAAVAEEAAQEAFARAFARWRRVSVMERPAGWVYVVAVRHGMRLAKRDEVDNEVREVASDDGDASVGRDEVRSAVESLAPRQRIAVILRFYDDLPVADIAKAMRCSPGTVKSTLHAALARLRLDLMTTDIREPEENAT
jgi:RNA polymerase sigma-70 factor (ECF subfamily)